MQDIKKYLFPAGVAVVIGGSFLNIPEDTVKILAVLLGLGIGYMNVDARERQLFLLSTVAIAIVGATTLAVIPGLGSLLEGIVEGITLLASAAATFVALLSIYEIAK